MQLQATKHEIATVSTASAGTLIGALHCAGVTPERMLDEALKMDLRTLAGDGRWRRLRRACTLFSWPYAMYPEPGIADVFSVIVKANGGNPDPKLRELDVPLNTAAVDVTGKRMLVYSSKQHPEMRVRELLRIAVSIPLLYPPHTRQGHEIMDASLASYAPLWLATGQREDLPIVVLRTHEPTKQPRWAAPWLANAMQSGVASRDTFDLERRPHVTVHDIETKVRALEFDLSDHELSNLVRAGRTTVAANLERASQDPVRRLDGDEGRAEGEAERLFRRHAGRLARAPVPTVFISYAEEDVEWVERLRGHLDGLLADAGVDVWDDSYLRPGGEWLETIEDAISRARVGIMLVSEHAIGSTFIREKELVLLRAGHDAGRLQLLWVSLDGKTLPELDAIQAVGDPARPLATLGDGADRMLALIGDEIEDAYYSRKDRPEA